MGKFFSKEDEKKIIDEISAAEKRTSGEIRLHVENRCWRDPLDRAALLFLKLKMNQTHLHNGILIYLALKKRTFAIVGDKGINEKVRNEFWQEIKDEMSSYFQKEKVVDGICIGIRRMGEKLKEFFPYADDDENELSDEISYGD
jgi:uncharacterized membrane protein